MKKNEIIRYLVLGFFLVLFSGFSLRHFILGGGIAASVDALCPFGGFETLFTFISTGGFVPRILMSSLVLGIGVLLTVIILKKGFCGYICPFGTVQELFGKITKKKYEVPAKIDKYARSIKYVILAVILIGTAYTGSLVFRGYDPFMTFFHFGKGIFWDYSADEFAEHIIPFVILIVTLGFSIFIERFWCKYLCPLGAIMNIFTKLGLTKISRDKEKCIDCKICDKKCPMKVKVSTVYSVKDVECINCNACITNCPKNALFLNAFKRKISISKYVISLLLIFFLVIAGAKLIGVWQSVPNLEFDENHKITGAQIKGWMTLDDVSEASGISVETILEKTGIGSYNIQGDIPLKEISNKYGIEFDTQIIRVFIDTYDENHEVNTGIEVTGEMSILDVSAKTGICIGHLAADLELPTNIDLSVPISEIAKKYNIDFKVETVQELVANFKHEEESQIDLDCPWQVKEDPYPGMCGLYEDTDKNGICDLSE